MNLVFILLGSNINKETNLPAAVSLLCEGGSLRTVSSVYETPPIGKEDQPLFWNASVLIETKLDAKSFKNVVLAHIEETLRRERTTNPYAPRTIDADMTLFNQEVFDLDDTHHIPDPDLLKFRHVAVPTAEIAPDLEHPETGETLKEIACRLVVKAEEAGRPPLRKVPDMVLC
jgi:2-amino-4-hydroxy-6-hydroxymethyldihydropteridine diphosphokinase